MDSKVREAIKKQAKEKQEIFLALRDIILGADKRILETVKWNQPTFYYEKTNLAFMYAYKTTEYVNFGFMNAVALKDPKGLFEGTGKAMRHIKIYNLKGIPAGQIKKWSKEALKLALEK